MSRATRPVWTENLRFPHQPMRNALILQLHEMGTMSFAEVGARLGCSRNVVAGVVDRARRRARRRARTAARTWDPPTAEGLAP